MYSGKKFFGINHKLKLTSIDLNSFIVIEINQKYI